MTGALTVINPVQGEALDLATASEDRLGQLLLDVREHESRLRELKQLVSEELHARWDKSRVWTTHTESGLTLTGKSDAPVVVWDALELQNVLYDLKAEGVLDQDAIDRTIETRIEYKVLARGVNALSKSPVIWERIRVCRTEQPAEGRRVSVSVT